MTSVSVSGPDSTSKRGHFRGQGQLLAQLGNDLARLFARRLASVGAFSGEVFRSGEVGSLGQAFRVWDVETRQRLHIVESITGYVGSVVVLPNVHMAAVGNGDGTVSLTDLRTGLVAHTLQTFGRDKVPPPAETRYRPHAARLDATGSTALIAVGASVQLWDLESARWIDTFGASTPFEGESAPHQGDVTALAITPDGSGAVSGDMDGKIVSWDLIGRRLQSSVRPVQVWIPDQLRPSWLKLPLDYSTIRAVAFSADASRVIAAGGNGEIWIWSYPRWALIRSWRAHAERVTSIAISRDGRSLVSGSTDRTIAVWDATRGRQLCKNDERAEGISAIASSPAHDLIAVAGFGGVVQILHSSSCELLSSVQAHDGAVLSVSFTPDGTRLLSGGSDQTVRIWDVPSMALAASMIGNKNSSIAMTPAGFFATSGSVNNLLAIVRGLDVTTIEQVHQSLFNPDLVREALAGDPEGEVANASEAINLGNL